MGIAEVIGGLSAIAGVIGGIAQAGAAASAAAEQREARNIEGAQQQVVSSESRRSRIREERIRRAAILAGSENQGTGSSSGETGAVSALGTNLAGLVSSSMGQSKANQGINKRLQSAADFESSANTIGAWTNTIRTGFQGFASVFDKK